MDRTRVNRTVVRNNVFPQAQELQTSVRIFRKNRFRHLRIIE